MPNPWRPWTVRSRRAWGPEQLASRRRSVLFGEGSPRDYSRLLGGRCRGTRRRPAHCAPLAPLPSLRHRPSPQPTSTSPKNPGPRRLRRRRSRKSRPAGRVGTTGHSLAPDSRLLGGRSEPARSPPLGISQRSRAWNILSWRPLPPRARSSRFAGDARPLLWLPPQAKQVAPAEYGCHALHLACGPLFFCPLGRAGPERALGSRPRGRGALRACTALARAGAREPGAPR